MPFLKTSNGFLLYDNHLLYLNNKQINQAVMLENLKLLSEYFYKIEINWGPAFGSLIGVVRNGGFLPWKPVFDIYILKEDEERFKDLLWSLKEVGFSLIRYERRGYYFLERSGEYIKFYVLAKISTDVRHTAGAFYIHNKYLQNTVKWNFQGVELNVPAEVDEYLTFHYGEDWTIPKPVVNSSCKYIDIIRFWTENWIQDHLPNNIYYYWLLKHKQKDFERFKERCNKAGIPLPENVQLSSLKPRKYKKILTVGVYDLIHKGHVELFRRAKALGDYLIVAVQDNDCILKYKPTAEVMNSTEDRMYMVKSIRYVDEVISYTDVCNIVQNVEFDVLVTGPDQCHDGFKKAIFWCEEHEREHIVLARTEGVSSSELKAKIAEKTHCLTLTE